MDASSPGRMHLPVAGQLTGELTQHGALSLAVRQGEKETLRVVVDRFAATGSATRVDSQTPIIREAPCPEGLRGLQQFLLGDHGQLSEIRRRPDVLRPQPHPIHHPTIERDIAVGVLDHPPDAPLLESSAPAPTASRATGPRGELPRPCRRSSSSW